MNESENERPDSDPQSLPNDRVKETEISSDATTDPPAEEESVFVAKLVSDPADKADDVFAETETLDPESIDAPLEEATDTTITAPTPAIDNDQPIREGSPFRTEPAAMLAEQFASGESAYIDLGPYRYTAMGAAVSALLITMFAGLGAWWFPAGGVLVAMLGALLSIVGMYSPNRLRLVSIGALVLHSGLFLFSYQRAIG